MNLTKLINEELCLSAQNGDADAINALLNRNTSYITMVASRLYYANRAEYAQIGIEADDLIQEGLFAMYRCIDKFEPDKGFKFLTFASHAVENAMLDLIRKQKTENDWLYKCGVVWADAMPWKLQLELDAVAQYYQLTPEQILIRTETLSAVRVAYEQTKPREKKYLEYRFGFDEAEEHTSKETAEHFRLTKRRAERLELSALQQVRDNLRW